MSRRLEEETSLQSTGRMSELPKRISLSFQIEISPFTTKILENFNQDLTRLYISVLSAFRCGTTDVSGINSWEANLSLGKVSSPVPDRGIVEWISNLDVKGSRHLKIRNRLWIGVCGWFVSHGPNVVVDVDVSINHDQFEWILYFFEIVFELVTVFIS